MMKFRTEISIEPASFRIDHATRILTAGSCFAEEVSHYLKRLKFRVSGNPYGILFNPSSIARMLDELAAGKVYTESDLEWDGNLWHSFSHHGSFSGCDAGAVLSRVNEAARCGATALAEAGCVILTFGTAWVYERPGGVVVANCHKFPAGEFVRRRLEVREIVDTYERLLAGPLKGKKVILTVSPIRHLKDGLSGNAFSKAILRVAAGMLAENHDEVVYFPAYEIVTDDLRDYRFYGDDMVHPSSQAVAYVCDKFSATFFSARTRELLSRIEKVIAGVGHRVMFPDSVAAERFRLAIRTSLQSLAQELPEADFKEEFDRLDGKIPIESSF